VAHPFQGAATIIVCFLSMKPATSSPAPNRLVLSDVKWPIRLFFPEIAFRRAGLMWKDSHGKALFATNKPPSGDVFDLRRRSPAGKNLSKPLAEKSNLIFVGPLSRKCPLPSPMASLRCETCVHAPTPLPDASLPPQGSCSIVQAYALPKPLRETFFFLVNNATCNVDAELPVRAFTPRFNSLSCQQSRLRLFPGDMNCGCMPIFSKAPHNSLPFPQSTSFRDTLQEYVDSKTAFLGG